MVSVDKAKNKPTRGADGPDGEVMLDIEVDRCGGAAGVTLVAFTPNTDAGFLDAITKAIHDTTNNPSILSISWGRPESTLDLQQSLTSFDAAFQDAEAAGHHGLRRGPGNGGSGDGIIRRRRSCRFPGLQRPHVLCCGGTSIKTSGARRLPRSLVWNDGAAGRGHGAVASAPSSRCRPGRKGGRS